MAFAAARAEHLWAVRVGINSFQEKGGLQ